jgi:3-hydroxyisobutyrate dehydrogenase-like beta-hydroxyacid dehydrogenase
MGSSIASRLLKHELLVSYRNPQAPRRSSHRMRSSRARNRLRRSVGRSSSVCQGPTEVTDLLTGPEGLGRRLASGTTIIDFTTSIPLTDVKIVAALSGQGSPMSTPR